MTDISVDVNSRNSKDRSNTKMGVIDNEVTMDVVSYGCTYITLRETAYLPYIYILETPFSFLY